jgi:type II secretory pathway component PulF
MPVFRYRAKKGPQDVTEGRIEAQNEKEAIEKINQMGYIPVRVEEERQAGGPVTIPLGKPRGRIKSGEITIFSRQLASLLKSGVPILHGLNIIAEQSDNPYVKNTLRYIHDAVKDGAGLSSALSNFPKLFSPLYIAMIRTGEDSGALPQVLLRISDYRIKQEEMLSRLRTALAYPILMAVVGIATIIFMLTFVMPRLISIFANMGQSLPLPTRILIFISQFLRQQGLWILVVLSLIILIMRRYLKTQVGKLSLSKFKLTLPLFGKFILKAELSRFCRTLELLLKNGIPILRALQITIPVIDNEIIKNRLRESYKELEQGSSFGKNLKNSKLFPLFMSNLIIVGEESGKLDDALAEVATTYERDTDEAIKIMSSLLEPMMILVMGLIVGFIVIAMLLPIFEINIMVH